MRSDTRPTIADVAREANVSTASVSRYLNGVTSNLSPATAERIEQTIRALDYRPNAWARSLKTQRSGLIAAVMTDLKNDYVTSLLDGMEAVIYNAGFSLLIGNTGNDPEQEDRILAKLVDQRVEGILIQPTTTIMSEALREVIDHHIPVVLVDRVLEGMNDLPMVGLDNVGAVELALAHLWGRGYRHLLYVTEPVDRASSRREREATVIAHKSEWAYVDVFTCKDSQADALASRLRQFVAKFPDRSAVLCSNSVTALHTIQAISSLGVKMPELGLITIDDPEWAAYVFGGITSIRQPTQDLGRQAAEMLLERTSVVEQPGRQLRLPAQIAVRASTRGGGGD